MSNSATNKGGEMFKLNPLIDIHPKITPKEILFRLENIHSALHQTQSVTGQISDASLQVMWKF